MSPLYSTSQSTQTTAVFNEQGDPQVRTTYVVLRIIPTAPATALQPLDIFPIVRVPPRGLRRRGRQEGSSQACVSRLTRPTGPTRPARTSSNRIRSQAGWLARIKLNYFFSILLKFCVCLYVQSWVWQGRGIRICPSFSPQTLMLRTLSVLAQIRGSEPQFMHGKGGQKGMGERRCRMGTERGGGQCLPATLRCVLSPDFSRIPRKWSRCQQYTRRGREEGGGVKEARTTEKFHFPPTSNNRRRIRN